MELNTSAEAHQGQQQTNDQQQATSNQQQQQQQQQQNQQPPYTIPGILHYLQYEWHRFEVDRQEWEVEKAELSARIALLQGEKKSHENLRHDLVRRIKMLEYCLRMERAKYHRLKHGTDPPPIEPINNQCVNQQDGETQQKVKSDDESFMNNNSSTVTYGRELLRHYLQEIGYTDTIIDLRSNRVRSLLGIVDNGQPTSNQQQQQQQQSNIQTADSNTNNSSGNNSSNTSNNNADNGNNNNSNQNKSNNPAVMTSNRANNTDSNTKNSPFAASQLTSNNANTKHGEVGDAESSVLATFGFLYAHEAMKDSGQLDDEEEEISEDMVDSADRAASTSTSEYSYFDKSCNDATSMIVQKLDSFYNGKSSTSNATGDSNSADGQKDINCRTAGNDLAQTNVSSTTMTTTTTTTTTTPAAAAAANAKNWCPNPQKSDVVDIGELASLTTLGSETNVDDYRKKQWTNKYRLQSHYDCVRALKFSEKDSLLVTASEDETIKLWHLSRPSSTGGKSRQPNLPPSINAITSLEGSTLDIEPLHTYRGHTSRILAITLSKNHIFSGAQNGELMMWKIISDPSTADQFDKYDSSTLVCKFTGHDEAIWSLETVGPKTEPLLCSASSDLTIKIWSTSGETKEPLKSIRIDSFPTCIARIPLYYVCQAGADIAVSSVDGKIRLYDIVACLNESSTATTTTATTTTTTTTTTAPASTGATTNESNTQPTAVLECDDSHRINSIVIHPTLPYLASADSNRNIKFWDIKTRQCKQTMVAHLDEVTSLACDPTGKYLLSASHDCSARLWLFEEKACIQEITSHRKKFDEGIFAVAFHPSSSHFATAGADGLAKVFV